MDAGLNEFLLSLRVQFLTRLATRLGLRADQTTIKNMAYEMTDREILASLRQASHSKRHFIWDFLRRFNPFA